MPWKFGLYWEDDEHDVQARAGGLLNEHEVSRSLGLDLPVVRRLMAERQLDVHRRNNRPYVTAASCATYVQRHGHGPSITERVEKLKRSGRNWEAMRLLEEAQADANREMARFGYGPSPSPESAPVRRDMGEDFVRKFGG